MTAKSEPFAPTEPPRNTALALREAAMLQTGVLRDAKVDADDDSIDIKALLKLLNKYKLLLLAFALLGTAVPHHQPGQGRPTGQRARLRAMQAAAVHGPPGRAGR